MLSVTFAFLASVSYAADTPLPNEARELVTQADSLNRDMQKLIAEIEKKPEIVDESKRPVEKIVKGGAAVFVQSIKVEGNTLLPEAEITALTKDYVNRKVTFGELQELTHKITNVYQAKGYLTSRAYIPLQESENGIVTMKILEGRIGEIHVENNKYFNENLYKTVLGFDKDTIFSYQELESGLYRLNRIPDLKVKAFLVAGETPGTSDVVLKATEESPAHYYYEFHNRGSNSTHYSRHTAHFDHNSVTGNSDALRSGWIFSEEGAISGGYAMYDIPFNHHESHFRISGNWMNSLLVKNLKPFEIKGSSQSLTLELEHRYVDTPAMKLDMSAAYELKDSKTSVNDFKSSFDRMRVAVFGPSLTLNDANGQTILSEKSHFGLPNFMGGSDADDLMATKLHSGGKFMYYTADFMRVQRVNTTAYMIFRASGQWTTDSLTSLEQFRAGGTYSVRGYPESDFSGDYGYSYTAEWHSPVPWLPAEWTIPFTPQKLSETLQLVLFFDGGQTFTRERTFETEVKDHFLLGTGAGFRITLAEHQSFDFTWGIPMGDPSSDKDRHRISVAATYGY